MRIAIVILTLLSLCGCEGSSGKAPEDGTGYHGAYSIRVKQVHGHEYIIFSHVEGIAALHSESCPCKEGGAE